MKKSLVALIALSSVSMAATLAEIDTSDLTLKAYWNFDTSSTPNVGSGWSENPQWNTAGYGDSTNKANHPYTKSAGLKASTGFTVSFDINNAGNGTLLSMLSSDKMNAPWRNLSITLDNNVLSAQFHGNTSTAVTHTLTESQLTTEWTTLTLVGSVSPAAATTLVLDFYVNGSHIGTSATGGATNITGNNVINRIQFGYYGVNTSSAPTYFDNILVYSRALSADEVKGLTIPEPTTATLSLLALAGLAARRRRK